MTHPRKSIPLVTVAASVMLTGLSAVDWVPGAFLPEVNLGTPALAKGSGGRAGGGSFRSSPRSSGSGSYSSPSRSYPSSPSYPQSAPYDPYNRGPVVVPVPLGPSTYGNPNYREYPPSYGNSSFQSGNSNQSSGGGWVIVALLLLGLSVPVVLFIAYSMLKGRGGSGLGGGELENNTVTVSKVQVALLAQARETQLELNRIGTQIDTSTPEGLQELLQESVLALLRTPENWSHVLGSSQTLKSLEAAETLFNQLAIAERSKFSVETLTNVGGNKKRYQEFKPDPDKGPASYIVVTLLVGTAHDQPLFQQIRTTEELKDVLQKLASLPADYLLVFELLWTPQEETDSFTYEELLTEYADMMQI